MITKSEKQIAENFARAITLDGVLGMTNLISNLGDGHISLANLPKGKQRDVQDIASWVKLVTEYLIEASLLND